MLSFPANLLRLHALERRQRGARGAAAGTRRRAGRPAVVVVVLRVGGGVGQQTPFRFPFLFPSFPHGLRLKAAAALR